MKKYVNIVEQGFFLLVYNIFLWTRLLRNINIPYIYYLIDICVCILSFIIFGIVIKEKQFKGVYVPFILSVLLLIIGLRGNMCAIMYRNKYAILLDMFCCVRFCLIFAYGACYGKIVRKWESFTIVVASAKTFIIVNSIIALVYMYLGKDMHVFYDLIGENILAISTIIAYARKKNCFWILCTCINLIVSGRMVAYAMVVVLMLAEIYLLVPFLKNRVLFVLIAFFIIIVLGRSEFFTYYVLADSEGSVRWKILLHGIELAKKYAPWGTGLGTYCSKAAQIFNSKVYADLNFSALDIYCSLDSMWGMVLGQFGLAGLGVICAVYLYFLTVCLREKKERYFLAMFIIWIYLLVYSFGGGALFTTSSIVLLSFGNITGMRNEKKQIL